MKIKTITVLVVIVILLILLLTPGFQNYNFHPFHKQSWEEKTTTSIENITVSQFHSSRYKFKSLFPYDFLIGNPQWGTLLYKSPQFYTVEDRKNLEFYRECLSIGIDLSQIDYFFLIEVVATAGFNMDEYLKSLEIEFHVDESQIIIPTPTTKLHELVILDHLKNSDFPDVEITPGKWRSLMELLTPKMEQMVIDHGLLEHSDETNRTFISELFGSLGWSTVFF